MALLAGIVTTANSLAKNLYDETNSEFGVVVGDLDSDRRKMCEVMARAIVGHIEDRADVRITTGDSGLQRDDADALPTLAPLADVVLTGAVE